MDIYEIAKKARKRRVESSRSDSNEFPIHSYCFDNSYVVYMLLKKKGYNPKIVVGTTEWYAEDLIREGVNLDELESVKELAGYVHFWVEINNMFVDISSHHNEYFGEILVTDDLPDTYYKFQDSYIEGEKTLNNAKSRICDYCGGRKNYCGCSKEEL